MRCSTDHRRDRNKLSEVNAVDDPEELLKLIENPDLTEFQYFVDGDNWLASIK